MPDDAGTLTTLTVTREERLVLARSLTMAAAMVDALEGDTRTILRLWERVQPDGELR